jgi:hypothetical protein
MTHVEELAPMAPAASRISGTSASLMCRPVATSSPDASASTMTGNPVRRQDAARIDDADHHGLCSRGLGDAPVRDAEIRPASGQAQLPEAPFPPPVRDAVGRLGGEFVRHVSEEHEVGR